MPDGHLQITPCEGGLIYELRLPWSELAPIKPTEGSRLGIFCIGFNNNGEGLLDSIHWPMPIDAALPLGHHHPNAVIVSAVMP